MVYNIYHLSDIHIRHDNRDELMYALNKVKRHIGDDKDAIIVITGDIFDRNSGRSVQYGPITHTFHDVMSLLDNWFTVIIPGNHDIREFADIRDDLIDGLFRKSQYTNIEYINENIVIDIDGTDITFYSHNVCLPNSDFESEIDHDRINIGLFHEQPNKKRIEHYTKLYDLLLLGDRHEMKIGDKWGYPGSLIQHRMCETLNKGYLKWTVGKNIETTVEYRPLKLLSGFVNFTSSDIDKAFDEVRDKFVNIKHAVVDWRDMSTETRIEYHRRLLEEFNYEIKLPLMDNLIELPEDDEESKESSMMTLRRYIEDRCDEDHRDIMNKLLDEWQVDAPISSYKLLKLKWSNLYAYGEDNEVTFPESGRIIHLDAPNNMGKSSLIDILIFSIYGHINGSTYGKNYIQNHHSKFFECEVSMRIESDGSILTIKRYGTSKSSKRTLTHIDREGNKINPDLNADRTVKDYIHGIIGDHHQFMMYIAKQSRDYTKIDDIIHIPLMDRLESHRQDIIKRRNKIESNAPEMPKAVEKPSISREELDRSIKSIDEEISIIEGTLNEYSKFNSETINNYSHRDDIDDLKESLKEIDDKLSNLNGSRYDHGIDVDESILDHKPDTINYEDILRSIDIESTKESLRTIDEDYKIIKPLFERYSAEIEDLHRWTDLRPIKLDLDKFDDVMRLIEDTSIISYRVTMDTHPIEEEHLEEIPLLPQMMKDIRSRMESSEYMELMNDSKYRSLNMAPGIERKVDSLIISIDSEDIKRESLLRKSLDIPPITVKDPSEELLILYEERSSDNYQNHLLNSSYRPIKIGSGESIEPDDNFTPADPSLIAQESKLIADMEYIASIRNDDMNIEKLEEELKSIIIKSKRNQKYIKVKDLNGPIESIESFLRASSDSCHISKYDISKVDKDMKMSEMLNHLTEMRPAIDPSISKLLCKECVSKFALDDKSERLQHTLRYLIETRSERLSDLINELNWRRREELQAEISGMKEKIDKLNTEESVRNKLRHIRMTRCYNEDKMKSKRESMSYIKDIGDRIKLLEERKRRYEEEKTSREKALSRIPIIEDKLRRIEEARYIDRILTERAKDAKDRLSELNRERRRCDKLLSSIAIFIQSHCRLIKTMTNRYTSKRLDIIEDIKSYESALSSRRIIQNSEQHLYNIYNNLVSKRDRLVKSIESHEAYMKCHRNIDLMSRKSSLRSQLDDLIDIQELYEDYDRYIESVAQYEFNVKSLNAHKDYIRLLDKYTDEVVVNRYKRDIEYRVQLMLDKAFPDISMTLDFIIEDEVGKNSRKPKFIPRFIKDEKETLFFQQAGSIQMMIELILKLTNIIMDDSRAKFIIIDEGFGALDPERSRAFEMVFEQMKIDLQFAIVIDHTADNVTLSYDDRWTIESLAGKSKIRTLRYN